MLARSGATLALLLFVGAIALRDYRDSGSIPAGYLDLLPVVRAEAGKGPIAILSTSVYHAFPLVNYSGAAWGLRFNALWMLPGFYRSEGNGPIRYHDREEMSAAERFVLEATVDDLLASRPALLAVDRHPYKQGFGDRPFDFLGYLARDPRFPALLRGYDSIGVIDHQLILRRRSERAP